MTTLRDVARCCRCGLAATALTFSLAVSTADAQPLLNRLVCPVSIVGAGCMRVQVNVADGLLNVFLQNLQRPAYPGDPWISSLMSIQALGTSSVGTPGPVWGQALVGYYGAVQNITPVGQAWLQFQEWEPVQSLATAGFMTAGTQSGIAGCTSGNGMPNGAPLGFQTCQQQAVGAVALQGVMPSWLTISALHLWGWTYNYETGARDSWVCDAANLGHHAGPVYSPAIECDVTASDNLLNVGAFTPLVTPEPGTLSLFALGAFGIAWRRRRRGMRLLQDQLAAKNQFMLRDLLTRILTKAAVRCETLVA